MSDEVDKDGQNGEVHGEQRPQGKPPVRVCPTCSAQSETFSDTCPHCGGSFIRSRRRRARKRMSRWSKKTKVTALVLIAALVGVAVAAGVIIKVNHDNQVAEKHEEEDREQELAREKADEARIHARTVRLEEQQAAQEELKAEEELQRIEVKYGHEVENELEQAITKDANGEAEEGFSEYVSKTNCEPEGGRIETSSAAQNFNCLAVTSENNGTQRGYRYSGTINYIKGSMTWRYGG